MFLRALSLLLENKPFVVFPPQKKKLEFYIKNSSQTIFVPGNQEKLSSSGQELSSSGQELSSSEQKVAKLLTTSDMLIKPVSTKQIKTKAAVAEYGVEQEANLCASDLSTKNGFTNLKLNYQGNSVPLWLTGNWSRREIEKIMGAVLVSLELDVNLVSASQALKNLEK